MALSRAQSIAFHLPLETSTYSVAQLECDSLQQNFTREVLNPSSLLGMTGAGLTFRLARSLAFRVLAPLFAPQSTLASCLVRTSSTLIGFGAEVLAFEGITRGSRIAFEGASQSLLAWEGEQGLRHGLLNGALTLGSLKLSGHFFQTRNIALQHFTQDSAMVLAHQLAAVAHLNEHPQGSLAQQFLHAEASLIQMNVGMRLAHGILPSLRIFEQALHLSSEIYFRQNSFAPRNLLPEFSARSEWVAPDLDVFLRPLSENAQIALKNRIFDYLFKCQKTPKEKNSLVFSFDREGNETAFNPRYSISLTRGPEGFFLLSKSEWLRLHLALQGDHVPAPIKEIYLSFLVRNRMELDRLPWWRGEDEAGLRHFLRGGIKANRARGVLHYPFHEFIERVNRQGNDRLIEIVWEEWRDKESPRQALQDFRLSILLRRRVHEMLGMELATRKSNKPHPTADELSQGCYDEAIEIQVRDAIRSLRRKGYATVSSGFHSPWKQQLVLQQFMDYTALRVLQDEFHRQGIYLEMSNLVFEGQHCADITIHYNAHLNLQELTYMWNRIANSLPDLHRAAPRNTSPIAIEFRAQHS